MIWDRFFHYLNHFNAIALFLILCAVAFMLISEYFQHREWDQELPDTSYASPGLDGQVSYEGGEIETPAGATVSYQIEQGEDRSQFAGKNLSFTEMQSGQSRLVLPDDSDQKIFRWETIGLAGEGSEPALAYFAFAGTNQDHSDGFLDLIIGRFSDLEQRVIHRRLRFVDAARMIDENTMSMIVWFENEKAEFWLIDIATFEVTMRKQVRLPKPEGEGS